MTPRPHQYEGAMWALKTVREKGFAYMAWKERTGKTLTALMTVEISDANTCLIITKKKAIPGWADTLNKWFHVTDFTVINYESIHKIEGDFDFIILDEAHHAISGFPKPSKTWKAVYRKTFDSKPILYLSATPYAEHLGLIYHQLKLSKWSPFKQYKNFYDFHRHYGIRHMTRTTYGLKETYSKWKVDELLEVLKPYFNFKTRQDVGIEYEPEVNVVTVDITDHIKKLMIAWREDKYIDLNGDIFMGDSDSKLRSVHYQLEGGTIKTSDTKAFILKDQPKIDYIKANYDVNNIAIMAHFIAERALIKERIPEAIVLSSDGDAEGVDLSHIYKLIVYSMSFKTSKHTQRVARQANHNRDKPIIVDILVADKPGIGMAVYDTVAVKQKNFIKSSYERVW